MINTTECCKTIGCNCGGTRLAESLSNITPTTWIVIILCLAVGLAIIWDLIKPEKKQLKNSNNKFKKKI